jgi:hypothetical protein
MMCARALLYIFAIALTGAFTAHASTGERAQTIGEYVVHYNAFGSDSLTAEVARTYGITRSRSRGLLNIVVLKKVMGTTGEPVTATLSGSASNLSGQLRELTFRQVKEGNAIYYLSDFHVSDKETLNFTLQVKPAGDNSSHTVKFSQQFFTR